MEKELFQDAYIKNLDKNFNEYSKYFHFEYRHFYEFRTVVFQAVHCLVLEFDFAAITITNHILERLLKNALISNEVGTGEIPIERLNTVFAGPSKKYDPMPLGNTIELCRKQDLITHEEKEILFGTIREQIRNGFSHADPSKILFHLPDEMIMLQGSLDDPTNLQPINLNPKTIPTFQAIQMESFARAHAKTYFVFVFDLLKRIENRLLKTDTIS